MSPGPCVAAPQGQDRACDRACDTWLLRVERATAFSGFRAGPPGREHPCLAGGGCAEGAPGLGVSGSQEQGGEGVSRRGLGGRGAHWWSPI